MSENPATLNELKFVLLGKVYFDKPYYLDPNADAHPLFPVMNNKCGLDSDKIDSKDKTPFHHDPIHDGEFIHVIDCETQHAICITFPDIADKTNSGVIIGKNRLFNQSTSFKDDEDESN